MSSNSLNISPGPSNTCLVSRTKPTKSVSFKKNSLSSPPASSVLHDPLPLLREKALRKWLEAPNRPPGSILVGFSLHKSRTMSDQTLHQWRGSLIFENETKQNDRENKVTEGAVANLNRKWIQSVCKHGKGSLGDAEEWVLVAETLTRKSGEAATERNDYIPFTPIREEASKSIRSLIKDIETESLILNPSDIERSGKRRFKISSNLMEESIVELKQESRVLKSRIKHLGEQKRLFEDLLSTFQEDADTQDEAWRDPLKELEEENETLSFDDYVTPVARFSAQQSRRCTRRLQELKVRKVKLKETRKALGDVFL